MILQAHHLQRCFGNLSEAARRSNAEAVLQALSECMVVRAGIAQQFLYRSLYAPQITRCLHHIPREQMMILSSNELESNASATMSRVENCCHLRHDRL